MTREAEIIPKNTITTEAKWLGLCTADQKPGDMITAGRTKMNVLDIQKGNLSYHRRRRRGFSRA